MRDNPETSRDRSISAADGLDMADLGGRYTDRVVQLAIKAL